MKLYRNIYATLALLSALVLTVSCSAIKDDEPVACPQGLEIRFVYDYNLERADAFSAQVDCLTLHIYDSQGNYVRTLTETSDVLADENYRMRVDGLPEGEYRLVAYGGAECDRTSFGYSDERPAEGSRIEELGMRLDPDCLRPGNPRGRLHDHFYGSVMAEVKIQPELQKVTVRMLKNTNHIRIYLQHLSYEPLDGNDYDFEITDDNTLFDCDNNLVDAGNVTYTPWEKGSYKTGEAGVGTDIVDVRMAYADLSTSRLMTHRSPRLVVRHRLTGSTVIDIPLVNYFMAMRGSYFDWCGEQEFLDRKSDWNLFFFLDDEYHWNEAFIKVDNWIVRLNEING